MGAKWGVGFGLAFGIIAFILTYSFSIVNNTWLPSLFRAVIGFFLFACIGYLLRFVLKYIGTIQETNQAETQNLKMNGSISETVQEPSLAEETANNEEETVFQSIPLELLGKSKDNK